MLMKLKNYQILNLLDVYSQIEGLNFKSTKGFSYAVIINEGTLAPNKKALIDIAKPSPEFQEFEIKREAIIAKYAKYDDNGVMVVRDDKWVEFKDGEADLAKSEIDDLIEEHKELVDGRTAEVDEYNKILEDEVEVNLMTISLADVPDYIGERIHLMKLLSPMID